MNQITKLATSSLHIHPENIKFFDDIEGEQYERFKKSIQEDGILTPLMIAPDMTIISGHQRYKACKDLGINLVPVIIREDLVDEDEKLKKLLATNFGRLENNPMKQSRVITEYEKLCEIKHGGARGHNVRLNNQEQIASEFGITPRQLRRLKKLQDLIPELQDMVEQDELSATIGHQIWARMSQEEQEKFFNDIGRDKIKTLTQKATKEYIDRITSLENDLENEKKKEPKTIVKEVEKVVDKTDYEEINKLKNEKRQAELELLKLKDKLTNPQVIYKNNPELEKEVERLKRIINNKEEQLSDYHKVRTELAEKNKIVAQFTGENTNLELMSTTSKGKAKMMEFLTEMSKYDYLAESFNEIPVASRNEWIKAVKGIYKWSKNILDEIENEKVVFHENSKDIVYDTEFTIE
ncbi:ParB/RepB/Spo0J family partition protein [Clostridium perfringens]|uniref:ParB/RepB/Spo0J family partition protein n=1 Tax=Clostridium perfringens TaxID=1502 RepID=UPI00234114B5|nr:ParB/RepB/Spo0J family partition protein [Clostridium perfringens]MDC4245546.1 ParB/RepB/Spo0J family partition protein [Clostridium perfringens]